MTVTPHRWEDAPEPTSTAPVMFYQMRDLFRWCEVTGATAGTVAFVLIMLTFAGAVEWGPGAMFFFEEFTTTLAGLENLPESVLAAAGAVFSVLGVLVYAPVAWLLGRSMISVSSPLAHGLVFTVLGALLGLSSIGLLGLIGSGIAGLSLLTSPLTWTLSTVLAAGSTFGWMFAYHRQHEELDWRWWEILFDNWLYHPRRR